MSSTTDENSSKNQNESIANTKSESKSMKNITKSLADSSTTRRNPDLNKMEDSLTNEKLLRLEQIFEEADEDGGGGLDMEEFRNAMRQTMGDPDIEDHELDMIFMKVDTNCDGTVDWDEYLTYTLLECREKDIMHVQAQQPFPRTAKLLQTEHRDSIIRLIYQPAQNRNTEDPIIDRHAGRYISVGRDGIVTFWNMDMKEIYTRKIEPVLPKGKTVWVTDMCLLPKAGLVAVTTTTRVILFYDVNSNRFEKLSRIVGLEACPTTIFYWSNEFFSSTENFKSVLIWGDDHGGVCVVTFGKCPLLTVLNPKRMAEGKRRVHLKEIIKGQLPEVKGNYLPEVHGDTVLDIKYEPSLDCFLSCCKDSNTAMFMGDVNKRITSSYFKVHRGINTFDYCKKLNIIVSGGYDTMVRVWNPYVTIKPVILLDGHQSPVLFVCINALKEHVISFAENKEIRIHDLNSQTCIQTFFKKMLPDLGPRVVSACLFNPYRQAFVFATTVVSILEAREEECQKQLMTHTKPVTAALFNPLFNQVVSAGWDSMVCVWNFVTGRKEMQFKAHTIQRQGETYDVEITALTFDPSYRRLITAGREGRIRIWNFNNGAMLRELQRFDRFETTAITCLKQRIYTAGWNKRITIYIDRADDDMVQWLRPVHKEDVTSLCSFHGHVLASSTYNGDIYLWSVETGRLMFCLNAAHKHGRPLSPCKYTGETPAYPTTDPTELKKSNVTESNELAKDNIDKNPYIEDTDSCPNKESCRKKKLPGQLRRRSTLRRRLQAEEFLRADANARKAKEQRTKRPCNAVEQALFLENRENTRTCATLLTANTDGYVRAWSIDHYGGLLGQFHAAHRKGDGVTCMHTDPTQTLLLTGDAAGYIKLWDINHYCTGEEPDEEEEEGEECTCEDKYSGYPFIEWMGTVKKKGYWAKLFPNLEGTKHPHLITSFKAHVEGITSVQYIHMGAQNFIISGGFDASVRLWTVQGEFIGIFGVSTALWNLKALKLPVWRDGGIQTPIKDQGMSRKKTVLIPPDVRKVASSTSLRVLYAGKAHSWSRICIIIWWLMSRRFKRAKKQASEEAESDTNKSESKSPPPVEAEEEAEEEEEEKPEEEYDDEDDIEKFLSVRDVTSEVDLTYKPDISKRRGHLGKFRKRVMRHQQLPTLPQPIAYQPSCAVYRSLPFHELETLPNLMKIPNMKEIQVEYKLTPLGAQSLQTNRISRLYQRALNKDMSEKKKLSAVAGRLMKEKKDKLWQTDAASKNRRERQSLMGNYKPETGKRYQRRVTLMLESARNKGDVPLYTNIRQTLEPKASATDSIAEESDYAIMPGATLNKKGYDSSVDSMTFEEETTHESAAAASHNAGKLMTVIEE